jgi:iron(III) transport system ATP-binding protein
LSLSPGFTVMAGKNDQKEIRYMIVLEDVCKAFGNTVAVDQVSLVIPDRARVAILGPSGSGKTTLLRLVAGLEMPDKGTISMGGHAVSGSDVFVPPSERRIGFVFQSGALWPHMTVAENILFAFNALPEGEQQRRLDLLLDRMAIPNLRDRYPDQISGGEARRVALARALAPRPEILLLDEPLTNLDHALREELLVLIAESAREEGSIMLYVTHDEHEAAIVADSTIRFKAGRVLE